MKKNMKTASLDLRQKAEERLKNNLSKPGIELSDAKAHRLIHELEVHQVELEMQNEELILAKEQAIIASEKYMELYDFAPFGYFTLSPEGEIIQLNLACAAILGAARSELKNRLFHVFVSDNSKPLFLNFIGKVFSSGKKESCELTLSVNDDMPFHVYITGIVSEKEGNCLITMIDITERSKAEEDFRLSSEFNQLLLQNMPLGMDIVDEEGNILFMSDSLKQHFGVVSLDKKCWELYHDDKKQCQECPLRAEIKTGETSITEAHGVSGGKIFEVSHTGMIYNGKKALLKIFVDITSRKLTEALLKESEKKYHAIFNNVQDVFYQTDLNGIVLDVSPSIKHFSDFNREEIIGKPITNLYYDPNDRAELIDLLKKKSQFSDYELRLKTRTGELRYVSNNARLVFDSGSKPNHIDGEIKDITLRKLAEIELQASKDFLNSIINAVASPVFVKDENHKCVLVNNALCSFLEIPKEKIIGSTDSEYFPEEQVKVFIEKENEVLKTGKENCSEEFVTDKTGKVRTIVTRKTLYTDTAGNKFLVGIINDITERKLSENALRESQLLLKASIESPKDMIVLSIDKQYNYLYFNTYHKNVMLNAYGKNVELGMNLLDCINNEDDRLKAKTNYDRAFNGESHTTIEEYGELARYYYETRFNPILNAKNEVIGATAFSSNITERKLAEKQIERLNRVYTVLSNINKTIIRVRDKQLLFEEACRIAVINGGFKMAWVGIVHSSTNKIEVVASSGKTGDYLNNFNIDLNNKVLNSGPAGQAIINGKYNFSNNIQSDDRTFYWKEKAREYGFRSIIALPLIVWGKTIGVYMIYSGEIDFFNADEIKLLEEMASDISFAIEFIESEKERKQAEELLLASEMKYHNIFNNVQDVFYQTDLAGTILDVSPSIKIFSGFNRDEIIGKPVTNLYYDPNDRVKVLDLLKEKGELRDYELRLKNKAGEIKYTSNNARLVFDSEGKPDHIDGAVRDITERKLIREKLKQSEERFQLAMKASKDGLFDWNLETNEIYYAPGWKKIIGYKDHELPNDFSIWEQTTEPLDVKKSWELQQKLITKQIDRFVLEFKMKHKDGHWVDILSQAKAIFNEDGKAIRIVGTHTDISERKKAEEALRESTRILLESQAVANIGAYVTELTATEFEANAWKATPEIYKIFGIDETYPHTLAGWVGFIHPDSREELLAYHYQVVAERKRFDHEYKIIRINDGAERWVHGTGELEFDNQRNPIRMLGTIQDITERKLNETELIEKEVQFRNLSNAGLALIWTSGTDKLCNYFNEKWLTFTGRRLEQEMGNGWTTGVHPDDFDRCVETYFTAFDKREPFEMEYRLLHVSGEYRWLLDIGSPNYKSTGEFIGYIGNCFDITDRKRTEEALRKSEAIQRKIVSNIGDVIVIIDQNGINRYKSPNIETLFGWKPEDLVGKSTWNVVHPEDLVSSQKIVAKIASTPNATETTEIRYMRKDGEFVWIEITLVNLLSDPDIQGILGNYHDITERRLAQAKIREKDLEFKKLSSNLPDLIFQFTRKPDGSYYIPVASDGIRNIFGCSPEEVINDFTPISRVIHPDDVERVIADIEYSAKHVTFFTCEFRVLKPGKPIQWIYSKSTPEKLPDGSVTWYGFNADITERKRVEDLLVKLKTAIDKSEISVVITDRNGIIEYANPFFSELTGYSPDEYIGKNPRVLKSAYHQKEFYEVMWNTIMSGRTWEGEFYNCKKNGEMYWENAIISPIANSNNEITHFVAIKADITHTKNINSELLIAKEHAEESDRLKSAFLANMSHEIRTPMNGILGFTELLKEPDLSGDQLKYYISIIEKSGARLLNIINDIIDISKIESGQMKLKLSVVNSNEYLNHVLDFFQHEAEIKNIKLICKTGLPFEQAFFKTDGDKFYAILTNLVKNALKYTENGFIEFGYNHFAETQCLASLPPNHSYLQFYVKDTGIGIPKDRQEAIFERFVQADIEDKMARQGAGLGLSISKAYVEMLKGRIWVESEEENWSDGKSGGSTFYFTLPYNSKPIEASNDGIEILIPSKEIHINPEVLGLKILIAEDDEPSSELASIAVMKFGKEIIKTQTGKGAVEACRNNPDIDLVLMDIQMPEMNGYEAARLIRQFNKKVIIIALTAFALAGDKEKAIKAGCNDYISKPIQRNELVGMIEKYFKV
jgi:PAS domain S-box-containing protein